MITEERWNDYEVYRQSDVPENLDAYDCLGIQANGQIIIKNKTIGRVVVYSGSVILVDCQVGEIEQFGQSKVCRCHLISKASRKS